MQTTDDLQVERQRLALDAANGSKSAKVRLEAIEHRLADAQLREERESLAEQERQRRAAAEEAEALIAHRKMLSQAMSDLCTSQRGDAQALDDALAPIFTMIRRIADRGDELSNIALQLGAPAHAYYAKQTLASWLAHQLATLFPRDFPRETRMARPLVELLPTTDIEEGGTRWTAKTR